MEKMIVFDLNCTLLKRIEKKDKLTIGNLKEKNIIPDGVQKNNYVYLRPHLSTLANFLHTHNVRYTFWTTCMKVNCLKLINIIQPILHKNDGYLCQDDCTLGTVKGNIKADKWVKNLDVVKKKYSVDSILVDDSIEKRYDNQPIILADEFTGFYDDYLLKLTEQLHKMTICDNKDCTYTALK